MTQYRTQVPNGSLTEQNGSTRDVLKEAAKDLFSWLFCLMYLVLVIGQNFKDFLPSVRIPLSPLYLDHANYPTDHEDYSIRQADDLARSSSRLHHLLFRCLRPSLRFCMTPKVYFPHYNSNYYFCRQMLPLYRHS
jgi:hypothetical protein